MSGSTGASSGLQGRRTSDAFRSTRSICPRISEPIRRRLIFEEGYGAPFGIADSEIAAQTGGMASRHELLADLGTVIISKPVLADLQELREGGVLWGYVHCAQQRPITQAADRSQTDAHRL